MKWPLVTKPTAKNINEDRIARACQIIVLKFVSFLFDRSQKHKVIPTGNINIIIPIGEIQLAALASKGIA